MIKDFGSQKLPRFRAGLPLVEQVTAERLNDICSMIEACRLQNGVGYTMNRSLSGTTLSILDNVSQKNSHLWCINLGDEFSNMEKSLMSIYTTKDTDPLPSVYVPNANVIRSCLETAFSDIERFPKTGDAVWNERDGLRYIIFTEKAFVDGGGTSESGFYAVKFKLGKDESVKIYYALYVGEHIQEPEGREPTKPIEGPPGPAGPSGEDGEDGKDGKDGKDGEKGE